MAASGERRLVFDTRGKRKHVVRVVYAILALLMGGSLFLVVGPVNIGALLGSSGGSSNATKLFDEQAERIEARLAKDPNNEQLLLLLTRARINGGNSQIEPTAEGAPPSPITTEARKDFDAGGEAWSRYLKQAKEPSASAAQLVSGTFFHLAEVGSTSLGEIQENVELAASAQRIAAQQQPSLGSLSTLAIYEYFAGNFAAADKARRQTVAKTSSKAEAKSVEEQLTEYRKRAKKFQEGVAASEKQAKKAGKENLQNPFGFGGTTPGG